MKQTVKDFRNGNELKFETKDCIKLHGICIDIGGNVLIFGIVNIDLKDYISFWSLEGELWHTNDELDGIQLDMELIEDLKPCPFCGSNDLVMDTIGGSRNHYMDCKECGVFVNTYERSKSKAIKKWNRRA